MALRFTVATDIHLGHAQNHETRSQDSFIAFAEVLSQSNNLKVDFLLLGGDLFDEVNPSQKTLYKCLKIMNEHVVGEAADAISMFDGPLNGPIDTSKLNSVMKDKIPQKSTQTSFQTEHTLMVSSSSSRPPNFMQAPIKLPIFSIHGNHDYPSSDFGRLSVCDLLHTIKYMNYFGKQQTITTVKVKPIIIECRGTKMALYGLGYVKDTILHDLFSKGKVEFQRPPFPLQECFCLLILHQNRYRKSYVAGAPYLSSIDSKWLPDWMDLIIWGHEHEAKRHIDIEDSRRIYQIGSTVVTSFIEAESGLKQMLLVEVTDKKFIHRPIDLVRSHRPLYCRDYEYLELTAKYGETFDLSRFLDAQISQLLQMNEQKMSGCKPMIRIKIEITGTDPIRYKGIEQQFSDKVANKEKILHFWKRKREAIETISDPELLQSIVRRTALRESSQVVDQVLQKLGHELTRKQLQFYNPQTIMDSVQKIVTQQSRSSSEIGSLLLNECKRKVQKDSKQLGQFLGAVDRRYARTIQARLNQIKNAKTGVCLDPLTSQQEGSLVHASQLTSIYQLRHQKLRSPNTTVSSEQLASESIFKPNQAISSVANQQNPGVRHNRLHIGHEVTSREVSEDCCERAQKTTYSEEQTHGRFMAAYKDIPKKTKRGTSKRQAK